MQRLLNLFLVAFTTAKLIPPLLSLLPLLSSAPSVQLSYTNRQLSGVRFWALFVYFILSSVVRRLSTAVGLVEPVEFVRDYRDEGRPPSSSSSSSQIKEGDGDEKENRYRYRRPLKDLPSLSMPFRLEHSDIELYRRAISASTSTSARSASSTPSPSPRASAQQDPLDILGDSRHVLLLLSALSEPAMLSLLAKRGCPIDPIGSVNVRNSFSLPSSFSPSTSDGAGAGEERSAALTLLAVLEGRRKMIIRARLDERVKKVKRGWEVGVVVELFTVDGERQSGQAESEGKRDEGGEGALPLLFKQVFTMLQFAKHKNTTPPTSSYSSSSSFSTSAPNIDTATDTNSKIDSLSNHQTTSTSTSTSTSTPIRVQLRSNDPSAWAALSKDYNPMHVSSLAAKAFGFKRKIAHGNHVVARAVEATRSRSRSSSRSGSASGGLTGPADPADQSPSQGAGCRCTGMSVEFRRPTFVPSSLDVRVLAEGLSIEDKGKSNVVVSYMYS